MFLQEFLKFCVFPHAAPSVAPTSLSVFGTTQSTITVQWEPVGCRHTNGDITGYSVRYGEKGSGREERKMVSGTSFTFSGFTSSTEYSVSVAAVNGVGVGPYTDIITAETDGELKYFSSCVCVFICVHLTNSFSRI